MTERRYLVGILLNGLRDEVRAELKLHTFNTLDELMNLGELVESRNSLLNKGSHRGPMCSGLVPPTKGPGGSVMGSGMKSFGSDEART